MREIKFRAWDKRFKEMTPWEVLRKEYLFCLDTDMAREFMQFTGLKDKNGKEIYEGDKIKFKMKRTKLVDHSVMVAFEDEEAIYQGIVKFGEFGWNPFILGTVKECEVIGNIYETPNLLTTN